MGRRCEIAVLLNPLSASALTRDAYLATVDRAPVWATFLARLGDARFHPVAQDVTFELSENRKQWVNIQPALTP